MPEVRYYTVTQERQVKVTANSAVDAARIAEDAFENGQHKSEPSVASSGIEGIWGNTRSFVRTVDIHVREDNK